MQDVGAFRVCTVEDNSGNVRTDQESVLEVFASFYEELYKEAEHLKHEDFHYSECRTCVSIDDIKSALKRLRNRKAGADDGSVAEMLKTDHAGLVELLATFFTDILNGDLEPPEEWKRAKLTLIFKNGSPRLPKNYRPI